MLADIGERLQRSTDERFKREQAPDGSAWAPLAAATLERKRRRGKILKINQQDGLLRSTIAYRVSETELEIGSIQPYSGFVQFGTRRMVARPYLGISEADEVAIGRIVADWLGG